MSCDLKVAVVVIFVLVALFYFLYETGHSAVFWATREEVWAPGVSYKEVDLPVSSGYSRSNHETGDIQDSRDRLDTLRLWDFRNYPGRNIVIFCHGTDHNITHRSYVVNACEFYHMNLILFDYRGYGKSTGKASQDHILEDALTVYDYTLESYPPNKIVLMGESLGGAPATYVATKRNCGKLVIFSSFTTLGDIIRRSPSINPKFRGILSGMRAFYDDLPNVEWIKKVKCPVCVVHSVEDQFIPYSCGEELFENAHSEKKIIKIKGDHSSPRLTTEQLDELFGFIDTNVVDMSAEDKAAIIEEMMEAGKRCDAFDKQAGDGTTVLLKLV